MTFFDCLHDMGDPAGASAHVHNTLKKDGTWMIVEPFAGDKLEENLNPDRARVLRSVHAAVYAGVAFSGGRAGTGSASGGETLARSGDLGRAFHTFDALRKRRSI